MFLHVRDGASVVVVVVAVVVVILIVVIVVVVVVVPTSANCADLLVLFCVCVYLPSLINLAKIVYHGNELV